MIEELDYIDELEPYRASNKGVYVSLLLSLVALAVECLLWYLLAKESLPILFFYLLNFLVYAGIIIACVFFYRLSYDYRFPLITAAMVIATGPFGALMALFGNLVFLVYSGRAEEFSKWLSQLYPDNQLSKEVTIYERIISDWEDFSDKVKLSSFKDVIAFGSREEKFTVLAKIVRNFHPDFVPVLRAALNDTFFGIRVQAASIFAKFERDFTASSAKFEQVLARNPHKKSVIIKYAILCEKFGKSGLFDKDRLDKISQHAVKLFEQYRSLEAPLEDVTLYLGKLYLKMGEAKKAKEILEPRFANSQTTTPEEKLLYMESLYELKEYGALHDFADKNITDLEAQNISVSSPFFGVCLWKTGLNKRAGEQL